MIQVRKRDGKVVPFDLEKIKTAILKDLKAIGHEGDIEATAKKYADEVFELCEQKFLPQTSVFDIENIQDTVVQVLSREGELRAVIAYCEYRYQHVGARAEGQEAPTRTSSWPRTSSTRTRISTNIQAADAAVRLPTCTRNSMPSTTA